MTKDFPLGRWVHQQRRAYRTGELEDHRKKQLDTEGMVWEPGDEAWETKLAALRSYHHAHGHLAPRQDALWGDDDAMVPIGQHLANLRRKGGLGKDAERAEDRAQQLAEIDPDWNCPWPLDWQRHHRILAHIATTEPHGVLPAIEPGVHFESDDLGRWLHRQKQPGTWAQLSSEQQERLTTLGVKPAQAQVPAIKRATKGPSKAQQAFQRGVQALTQWVEREGADRPVPRGHSEEITVGGETQPTVIKLGVWVSNTKARRDKLTQAQRAALAELGVGWA